MRKTPTASSIRPIVACFPEPPPPGTVPPCAEAGVMGALAGVLGSMMALEAIREIVGFGEGLVGRLLMLDARAMRFETLRYRRDPPQPAQWRCACHHRFERASLSLRRLSWASRCPYGRAAPPDSARPAAAPGGNAVASAARCAGVSSDVERAKRFGEAVATAGADQRHDVVALRRHPGDRNLGR